MLMNLLQEQTQNTPNEEKKATVPVTVDVKYTKTY